MSSHPRPDPKPGHAAPPGASSAAAVPEKSTRPVPVPPGATPAHPSEPGQAATAPAVPARAPGPADLVRKALAAVLEKSQDLRVELFVANWMPSVAQEAESLGFVCRTSSRAMGMKL
jgi:hypothetical protein